MNILFWTDRFYPGIGGIETQTFQLIQGLLTKNHRCLVFANQYDLSLPLKETVDGIEIIRYDFSPFLEWNMNGRVLLKEVETALKTLFSTFKPDIIHLSLYVISQTGMCFLLLRKMIPCPVVFTVHGIPYTHGKPYHLFNFFLEQSDQVCCVSNSVVSLVNQFAPKVSHKTKLIYNGLSLPSDHHTHLPYDPPVLLCLGRLSSEKGFDIAIKAFLYAKAEFPSVKMMIVGSGYENSSLEKLVNDLNLTDSIIFEGAVKATDVHSYIKRSTIVLMPSYSETFGLVAVEAAQMKRPVIACATGGLVEVIIDNETGILVPRYDYKAFSQAILRLLNNPALAIYLGENAYNRANQKFSLKNVVENYESVYQKLLTCEAIP